MVVQKGQLLATNYPFLVLPLRNVLSLALHTSKPLSRRVSLGPELNRDEGLVCYNGNTRTQLDNIHSSYPV